MSDNPGPSKRVRYDDPDFERTFLKQSEECGDEYSDDEEVDESYWEMSEHDSNSDDETNEVELDEIIQDEDPEENEMQKEGVRENVSSVTKSYYGRNRYKLSSECFVTRSRTQKHNIVRQLRGLKPTAKLGPTADPISV